MKPVARTLLIVFACLFPLTASAQAHDPRLPAPGLRGLSGGQYEMTAEVFLKTNGQSVNVPAPDCGPNQKGNIDKIVGFVSAVTATEAPVVSAAFAILLSTVPAIEMWARSNPSFLAQILKPDRNANCAPIGVRIPRKSTISNIVYRVSDGGNGVGDCTTESRPNTPGAFLTCQPRNFVGWVVNRGKATAEIDGIVLASFMNWDSKRDKWGNVTVTFTPPVGVTPKLLAAQSQTGS